MFERQPRYEVAAARMPDQMIRPLSEQLKKTGGMLHRCIHRIFAIGPRIVRKSLPEAVHCNYVEIFGEGSEVHVPYAGAGPVGASTMGAVEENDGGSASFIEIARADTVDINPFLGTHVQASRIEIVVGWSKLMRHDKHPR